ncbi:MAG: hypothetical protein UW81_C0026G0004 [Candidatus Giovannonibacteria bacterium GW2011_GWC2_44_9]|uniref:NAD-dependent epimerase/dehydratase domain-containing protein n=1 Tax=Candidatus Giovannonibacteria bacterium GW2011_GWC2_44_9 TaxID=1618658 RepID=A0A0G1KH88_9BACT|nr:MAG: hypothetical protein UW81_C0026G0004 [Candidatus Giovannonibacteria bacterium GW2011_GWC2_44_9]
MKLFITGTSGYIGGMLVERFLEDPKVEYIVALDMKPQLLTQPKNNPKVSYITQNLADPGWEEKVLSGGAPDIVIHCAWRIRELYGQRARQWKWNIGGSDRVFDFTFSNPSIKKLIYFSTVASYGSYPDNTIEHRFMEKEPFRKSDYSYAEEKRIAEERLQKKYEEKKLKGTPRGRYQYIRFGLQSALSGALKKQKSFLYEIISLWVSWVPITPKWLRQYIHEDDVADIIKLLSQTDLNGGYEVFNIAPPGEAVLGKDMAEAVGKKTLSVYPWMVRVAFFFVWHLTQGRVPTSPGSWKVYSYPIAVDGSKITRLLGFQYKYSSKEAFKTKNGYYSRFVDS